MKRLRVLAVTAGVLAGLVPAAPAAAFSPPELFVRMQPWDTHEPVGDWIPLASTPALEYLGGYRVTGCNGREYRLRRAGRFRGSFGARRVQVAVPRPRKPGYYVGRFAFGGTRFLRRSVDPAPMFLSATRRSFGFARTFARCPGYSPSS